MAPPAELGNRCPGYFSARIGAVVEQLCLQPITWPIQRYHRVKGAPHKVTFVEGGNLNENGGELILGRKRLGKCKPFSLEPGTAVAEVEQHCLGMRNPNANCIKRNTTRAMSAVRPTMPRNADVMIEPTRFRIPWHRRPNGRHRRIVFLLMQLALGFRMSQTVLLHLRYRRAGLERERLALTQPLPAEDELPAVLIEIPTFNEGHLVGRALDAAVSLDWPRDRLQIQLLDDSTDASADIARATNSQFRRRGHDVTLIQRSHRAG